MHKRTENMGRLTYKAFLLSILIFALFSVQHEAFSEPHEISRGEIRGYAISNTGEKQAADINDLVLMGAFASSVEPTAWPISLDFEYSTGETFYVGIIINNDTGKDKEVTVTFNLSGIYSGEEEEDFTIPKDTTYVAYIENVFGRPGYYAYKMGIKGGKSAKIKLRFTEATE